MPRDYPRAGSAPIEASPSKNAMMIDVVRGALDQTVARFTAELSVEREERRRWEQIAKDNREALVEIIGRRGEGGLVADMRASRSDQGKRIGTLEASHAAMRTEAAASVAALRAEIAAARHEIETRVTNLGWRTKVGFIAIASSMGAAGAGVIKLLETLF